MDVDLSSVIVEESDPRPRYVAIASGIRAHIRVERVPPGSQLPSTSELVKHFDVSKSTIAKALDELKADGVIESHQGAGVYVAGSTIESVAMRAQVENVFNSSDGQAITISFAGISSETLHGALVEPLARVRSGRYSPASISLRLLVPNPNNPWPMPCNLDGTDNPAIRERVKGIGERFTNGLEESITDLISSGLIHGAVTIRQFGGPPTHKIIAINDETYVGFYNVTRRDLKLPGQTRPIPTFALVGKETELIHYSSSDTCAASIATAEAARSWFESVWSLSE